VPHRFDPAHMGRLESEERRRRQPPERLLEALGVAEGWRVVDVGCGPGFYTLPAAERVGSTGRVYAVDVEPAMLTRVRERAAAAGFGQIETHLSPDEERIPLPDGAADAALLANVLHECRQRVAFLREVYRVLVPGGRLAVVEWRKEPTPMGPPLEERMSEGEVREALLAAGFDLTGPVGEEATGPTHFGLLARRPASSGRGDGAGRG